MNNQKGITYNNNVKGNKSVKITQTKKLIKSFKNRNKKLINTYNVLRKKKKGIDENDNFRNEK